MKGFTNDEVQKEMREITDKMWKEMMVKEFMQGSSLGTMLLERLTGPRPEETRRQRLKRWLRERLERVVEALEG